MGFCDFVTQYILKKAAFGGVYYTHCIMLNKI